MDDLTTLLTTIGPPLLTFAVGIVSTRFPVVGVALHWLLDRFMPPAPSATTPPPVSADPTSRPVLDAIRRLMDRVVSGKATAPEKTAAQAIYDATPDVPPQYH